MAWSRHVRSLACAGVVGAVLVAAAPHPSVLAAGLADPDRWVQRDGTDLVLAQLVGAVAWVVALWLAAGFVLVSCSRLPGAAGRTSAALARGTLPAGIRNTAAVALGVSLATSAGTTAGLPNAAAGGRGAPSAAAPLSPGPLQWPEDIDRLPSRADLGTAAHPLTDRSVTTLSDERLVRPDSIDRPNTTPVDGTVVRPESVGWPVGTATTDGTASSTEAIDGTVVRSDSVDWPVGSATADGTVSSAETVDWPVGDAAADGTVSSAEAVDWPGIAAASPRIVLTTAQRPAAVVPSDAVDWPTSGLADRVAAVDWPLDGATVPAPRSIASYSAVTRRADPVVVAPGDTLWSIASRRLGPGATAPAVAAEWRRWHAANRSLIGSDPRRLRPGTTLRPPTTG